MTLAVLGGTGIFVTTADAKFVRSNIAFILTLYSSLFYSGYSWTTGTILNGRLIFSDMRYVINSNTPSGGINVIERSRSNLPKRTH